MSFSKAQRWGPFFIAICAALFLVYLAAASGDVQRGAIAVDTAPRPASEVQAELDARGEQAGMELYMNSNIVAQEPNLVANLLIQNAETNENDLKVVLYGPDDVTVLYESDVIPAGYKIESAKLFGSPGPGRHECRAEFHVLGHGTDEDKSVVNASVTVTVLDG